VAMRLTRQNAAEAKVWLDETLQGAARDCAEILVHFQRSWLALAERLLLEGRVDVRGWRLS
jgi:hypothetical protein